MKRLNLMVPAEQYDWLNDRSEELGISVAEIVRRAIEAWMKSQDVEDDDLFQAPYSDGLIGGRGGHHGAAIEELRAVVKFLTKAVRRTAPPDAMHEFETRLEEWRELNTSDL